MRFVPVKTVEQQSILMAHRARSLLVRTMLANTLRAHLAELGRVANPGIANLAELAQQALSDENGLPSCARTTLEAMVRQIMTLSEEITTLDRKLLAWHAESEVSQRLTAIPGTAVAPTTSSRRRYRSPCLEMPPSCVLPPVECCCGVRPSQAANCLPDRNWSGSVLASAPRLDGQPRNLTPSMINWFEFALELNY